MYALLQPDVKIVGRWGGSMGAVTMVLSAARYREIARPIVVDSAFSSLKMKLELRIPNPIYRKFVRFSAEFSNRGKINEVSPVKVIGRISPRAVFIIQGMRDTAIPTDSAPRLFAAAKNPRFIWTKEKAYHLKHVTSKISKRLRRVGDQFL